MGRVDPGSDTVPPPIADKRLDAVYHLTQPLYENKHYPLSVGMRSCYHVHGNVTKVLQFFLKQLQLVNFSNSIS